MYKIIGADGKEYGPVSADQIRQWMAEGRVNADTRVLPEGSADWRRVADLPEFLIQAQTPPPASGYVNPLVPAPDARDRVNGPAIGLMVVAVLNFLAGTAGLFLNMFGTRIFADLPQDAAAMFSGTISIVSNALGLLLSAVIFYGALQLKNLSSYGMAMTASILAALPCTSPCCLVGLPIGIWAIVMLTKPEVKSAFTS